MGEATVVSVFTEGPFACMAIRVVESDGRTVEYIGRVRTDIPIGEGDTAKAWQDMTDDEKVQALVAAAKAERERNVAPRVPVTLSPEPKVIAL